MYRRFTAIAVILLALGSTAALGDIPLTVMSFNIRYGTANDGDNSWEHRKDIVVGMLREKAPTIIGTQECLDFQADYLVAHLPHYRWFGVGREADGNGERMAVLYRSDLVSPIDSGNFWLSETPDVPGTSSWNSACNRMATWAKFYHHESKTFFYYVNTHLDHKSEAARQSGAHVLLDFINTLPENAPVILTGDFNSTAVHSEPYTILTDGGMTDAWGAARDQVGPSVTWSAFKAPEPGTNRRIDWILTRGPVAVNRCETVTYNQGGRYPSDHFPVIAQLHIN